MADQKPRWTNCVEELKPLADYYRALGLPFGANGREVWLARDKMRLRYDPGHLPHGSPEQQAAAAMRAQIEEAYTILAQVADKIYKDPLASILLRSAAPPATELLRPAAAMLASPSDELLRSASDRKNNADTQEKF